MGYTNNDSLVLFCIGFGRKGCTLKSIISSSDYLDRSIIERETLQKSLNVLLVNGFIDVKNKRYFATDNAINLYNKEKDKKGIIRACRDFLQELQKENYIDSDREIITISENEYRKALGIRKFLH